MSICTGMCEIIRVRDEFNNRYMIGTNTNVLSKWNPGALRRGTVFVERESEGHS